jgi:hypothetical protein
MDSVFFMSASGDANFGSYRWRDISAFGVDDKVQTPLLRVYMSTPQRSLSLVQVFSWMEVCYQCCVCSSIWVNMQKDCIATRLTKFRTVALLLGILLFQTLHGTPTT